VGIDIGLGAYRTETTDASWPKCYRCTARFQDMSPRDRRLQLISLPYPVEGCQLLTRETPLSPRAKYKLVVRATCHGEQHQFVMECPRRWGLTAEQQALGAIWVFVPNGRGGYKVEHDRNKLALRAYSGLESGIR
jgi:hypothetical protein